MGVTSAEGAGKVEGVDAELAAVAGRLGNTASPGVEARGGAGTAAGT